jgi:hypothetical protein
VFAVWQDDTAPLGFGFMAIKGQQRLRELTDTDATLAPSMTGICRAGPRRSLTSLANRIVATERAVVGRISSSTLVPDQISGGDGRVGLALMC